MPTPYDQSGMFDPRTALLLGMGSGLLQASGPSKRPVSLGQAMGVGLEQGMLSSGRAAQLQVQMKEAQALEEYRKAQAQKMQQEQTSTADLMAIAQRLEPHMPGITLMARVSPQEAAKKIGEVLYPGQGKLMTRNPEHDVLDAYGNVVQRGTPGASSEKQTTLGQLMKEQKMYPQGSPEWTAYQKRIEKEQNRSEGVTIQNFPTPIAAIPPGGTEPELVQFGNKGTPQPTGYRPAPPKMVPRQVPAAITKAIADETEEMGIAAATQADLGAIKQQVDSGQINLGPAQNVISQARNIAGVSTEQSRNFQSMKATLEKLRNDSLRLNKGVQTEGDAIRAWNELLANMNDPKVVSQRLGEIQKINERAVQLRQLKIEVLQQPYGGAESELPAQASQQPAAVGARGTQPLPPKGTPLTKGTVYQTSRGPAKWDGMRFIQEE